MAAETHYDARHLAQWRLPVVGARLFAGLMLVSISFLAAWFERSRRMEMAYIRPDADALDFGEVWATSGFTFALPIKNESSRSLELSGFRSGCGCVSVSPASLRLSPGESTVLKVTLDLALNRSSDVLRIPFSTWLAPIVRGSYRQPDWEIRGTVRQPLLGVPQVIDLGQSLVLGTPFPETQLQLVAHPRVRSLDVEYRRDIMSVRVSRNNQLFTVAIMPSPGLPEGPGVSKLSLIPIISDSERLGAIEIKLLWKCVSEVGIVPDEVLLGAIGSDRTASAEVTLFSRLKKPIEVVRVRAGSPATVVLHLDGLSYRVVQRSNGLGNEQSHVDFVCRSGGKEYRVSTKLFYFGVAAHSRGSAGIRRELGD